MREYGGYIEFESFSGEILHEDAIALNCGRCALAYLCEARHIRKLYIPYFLCASVPDLCDRIGIEYEYYYVTVDFYPIFDKELDDDEWLYLVNYYGQLSNDVLAVWKQRYDHLIVDQAQSYFQIPLEHTDTLYTCRKYFGVADGAFLYTDADIKRKLPIDESFERMHFLLGRFERSANEFYFEYVANNKLFATEPIKQMSKLTRNLLQGINYQEVVEKRKQNYSYLMTSFQDINRLRLACPSGTFMYPLWVKNGSRIRKELQKMKIFIPMLWPNVLETCSENDVEYHFAADILPLPVDQRYNEEDMKFLVEAIKHVLSERT